MESEEGSTDENVWCNNDVSEHVNTVTSTIQGSAIPEVHHSEHLPPWVRVRVRVRNGGPPEWRTQIVNTCVELRETVLQCNTLMLYLCSGSFQTLIVFAAENESIICLWSENSSNAITLINLHANMESVDRYRLYLVQ